LNTYIPKDEKIHSVVNFPEFENEYIVKLRETKYLDNFEGIDKHIIESHLYEGKTIHAISKEINVGYKKLMRRSKIVKAKIRKFINN